MGTFANIPTDEELEQFCIAFGWVYGTAIEREATGQEPDDGETPESLWQKQEEEDRQWFRTIARGVFHNLSESRGE